MTATPGGTTTSPVPPTMCAAFHATARRTQVQAIAAGLAALGARAEQVRTDAWPPGGELVTPTMKVRRRPVLRAYADRIDALYAGQ